MPNLADLKAAAVAKLANVHPDVMSYITALEARVKAHAAWILAGTVLGVVLGFAIRSVIK